MSRPDAADDESFSATYLRHRGLIVGLAYDVTGSWGDAEDIAQETWIRWERAAARGGILDPRAYLARIATNLALDWVRRRKDYPGEYLPEPVPTGTGTEAEHLAAEEIQLALALVLQSMSPLERAAFVLHEAFGFSHPEIAEILGRAPAAVRQLVHRGRSHVQARRPRFDVDPVELERVATAFRDAALGGDFAALMAVLADDVVLVADGGGKASAAIRPILGADKVARFVLGVAAQATDGTTVEFAELNHHLAWIIRDAGRVDQVGWLGVVDGRIESIHIVRNPDKLARLNRR
ncbi:sigma-70 family RNA polymerase sigma factor [Granulicoccus sp. GXG6511]|uniref:sigma-70 family RNA polymerase sigma factor n=1 Tax=Granulicoccus sp. GXG6511 TaxID=3381351 RepID=UPI003D7D94D9